MLRETAEFSRLLRFHRIREHVLVCDVIGGDVFVLAVMHASMDLPERIAELEPRLEEEARFLHDRIVKEQGRG